MSDQTQSDTHVVTLNIDQARALISESKPAHSQVLGCLVAAAIMIREVDLGAIAEDIREDFLNLYSDCLDDVVSALSSLATRAAAAALLNSIDSEDAEGGAP